MFKLMSADQAVDLIHDGDCVYVNSFLSLARADVLHRAVYERFCRDGHPRDLTVMSAAGFGGQGAAAERLGIEPFCAAGHIRRVIAGHFGFMPKTAQAIAAGKLEGYNIPVGVISHCLRQMAGGHRGYFSPVGLDTFLDPRLGGAGMNSRSGEQMVRLEQLDGEDMLYYQLPRVDVAIMKGTAVDANGNIIFDDEYVTMDALAAAQAAHNNHGRVLVIVDRVTHLFSRPRNVIVPGALVDAVVVAPSQEPTLADAVMCGNIHVPPAHMDYWMTQISEQDPRRTDDPCREIIGRRGALVLRPGDIVNIGVGLPEAVGKYAAALGLMRDLTMTVEAGGFGGLPAPGETFGATIGADMSVDAAVQFDFYDGGGLDVCFMGALEADALGNVNVHQLGETFVGVGGFANITRATKTVVFCLRFAAKGLRVALHDGQVRIEQEGAIPKFRRTISTRSFSAAQALKNGQNVLYVTERCVFRLTEKGLTLAEVYPGVDKQKDILDQLDFVPAE